MANHIFLVYKDALKLTGKINFPTNSASRTLVQRTYTDGTFQIIGEHGNSDGTLYELIVAQDGQVTGNNRLAILWYLTNKWNLEPATFEHGTDSIEISKNNKRIYDQVEVKSAIGNTGSDKFELNQLGPASTWVKDNGVLKVHGGECAPASASNPVVISGTMTLEIEGSGRFLISNQCPE
jgi:hypothetical protein